MKKVSVRDVAGAALALGLLVSPLSFAYADGSASIQSLSPGAGIVVGTQVHFVVSSSGFNGPTFGVTDSFSGSSVTTSDLDSGGNFSWTPSASDVGTHILTLSVTDSSGATASAQQQITVSATPSLSITSLSNSGVAVVGTPLTLVLSPVGFSGPLYSLDDSFSGNSSLFSSDIDTNGNFSWTPSNSDIGTHQITFYAGDSSSHSAQVTLPVTVAATANAATPTVTTTSSLTSAQTQAILSLLQSFGADQNTINSVAAALGGQSVAAMPSSTPAPASSGYVFTEYLYPGVTDDQVTELQTVLAQKGFFSGPVTGYYGPITENAVIAYQASLGIDQLGVVGPATRAALNSQ